MNNNMSVTISNFENEAAKALVQKMIEEYGAKVVLDVIKKGIENNNIVSTETPSGTVDVIINRSDRIDYTSETIPTYKCGGSGTNCVEYDKKMDSLNAMEKIDNVIARLPIKIGVKAFDDKGSRTNCINHPRIAEFIVTYDEDGEETLYNILNLLVTSGDWASYGYGISYHKMEMLWHIIMLHKERKEEVLDVLHKYLVAYDYFTMQTIAHEDEDFRHRIGLKTIMTCWLEKQVCNALNLERKFEVAA